MLTVTFYGPMACGKTRTIRKAITALKAMGIEAANNEEAAPDLGQNAPVQFLSVIDSGSLRFVITGAGPKQKVSSAVMRALVEVDRENELRRARPTLMTSIQQAH